MRSIIALVGIAGVSSGGLDNCTEGDYDAIAAMNVTAMAQCFIVDQPGQWQDCLNQNLDITCDCAQNIGDSAGNSEFTNCFGLCFEQAEHLDCRACIAAADAQQVSLLAPTMEGSCGSSGDRELFANANISDIANHTHILLMPSLIGVSDGCASCLAARAVNCVSSCDVRDPTCLDCENVDFVSAMAYCNNNVWLPEPDCTVADHTGLDRMNPANVKTCIEAAEGDGFVECFGNPDTVNMNANCSIGLDAHIDYRIGEVCNTTICTEDNLSADCINCHGAIMVQEVFEHAPNGTGACGGSDDRTAITDVDMEAVIACGSEQASTGATCLAFQAEASEECRVCLEDRTERAMRQCKPHCADDAVGPDCMECVNIGLMSAAAHCNVHMSAAAGMMGLPLVSLAALISLLLIA